MPFPTALPASQVEPASEAPSIRWGILGSGWIAGQFIESVRAHTKQDIAAVGSRSKARAEEFASRMGIRQAYGDYDELVAANDLDVIYVATPHNLHHEGVMLARNSGKHVLVEKPHRSQSRPNGGNGRAGPPEEAVSRRSALDLLSPEV